MHNFANSIVYCTLRNALSPLRFGRIVPDADQARHFAPIRIPVRPENHCLSMRGCISLNSFAAELNFAESILEIMGIRNDAT